jgi:cytoskeletal protein CcmA (bactofilin family)
MALFKEQTSQKKDSMTLTAEPVSRSEPDPFSDVPAMTGSSSSPRRVASHEARESVIGSDITIEGKIEGTGHVRLAGRFKGDVHIQGDLTIDAGAKLTGGVRANSVVVGGEVEGNIESASRVELLPTGVLNGDLKAGTLTVAAGSRMRGRAEFGWGDELQLKPARSGLAS